MCLALGKLPSELDSVPPEDFHFFRRLYAVQPFGYRRDEFNTGLLASTIINVNRGPHTRSFSPFDLMPFSKAANALDVDEHNRRVMEAYARASQ